MFTYEDAVNAIDNIPKFLEAPSVAHTRSVLDALGSPDKGMKIIHVAGTNGKGSVCAFVSSMLAAQGKKVGTFTSPHLIKMNERIKIDNVPVSDETFLEAYLHVKECCKDLGAMNYFEYIFAMGMHIFSKADLDYVVLEVGLGGRMDGTNSVKNPVCCAITSISMDHVEVLGRTIPEIALAKAGIIKPGAKVVCDATSAEAYEVICKEAQLYDNSITGVNQSWFENLVLKEGYLQIDVKKGAFAGTTLDIPFVAEYQAVNSLVAVSVMEALGLLETEEQKNAAKAGLSMTRWPGRMQQVMPGVYIDGAHNEDGIGKFVQAVRTVPCKGRKLLLFSAVKEKDVDLMARHIGCEADFDSVMITEIENDRQLGCEILADRLKHYYNGPIEICPGIENSFVKIMKEKQEEDIVFIAGSLYLAGSIMEILERI